MAGAAGSDEVMGLRVLVLVRLGVVAALSAVVGVWSGMGGVTITDGMVEWCGGVFVESGVRADLVR